MLCPPDSGQLDPVALREVRRGTPQLFVDDFLIENRFDRHFLSANVPHVAHTPARGEPLVWPDKPWEAEQGCGYPGVVFDPQTQLFRLYYTIYHNINKGKSNYPDSYFLCYAQSADGLVWEKPNLGLFPWGDQTNTNIVLQGKREVHTANVHVASGDADRVKNIGIVPAQFLNGHRMVMYYCDAGHYLATSEDGIHWQEQAYQLIDHRIDCFHNILYDEQRQEFVSFLRNKLIFGGLRVAPDLQGNTRAISRLASRALWARWDSIPTSVLIPDQGDAKRFYSMSTFRYGDIYWGLLHHFDENPQTLEVELVFSRDGIDWQRLPDRPRLIPVGAPGRWDGGMIMAADRLIECGDEWRIYYSGADHYHDAAPTPRAIGVARLRKEGFVSLRAGAQESYLVTHPFHWPGGRLLINANAAAGRVQVQITDLRRQLIAGFDYEDGHAFNGDAVHHPVAWRGADIAALEGDLIRLEFKFKNADLFAFEAR